MTYATAIEVLSKRVNWLKHRIANSDKVLTYDMEEATALEVAIELMEDFEPCDGVQVQV